MEKSEHAREIWVVAITPGGICLARRISSRLDGAVCAVPQGKEGELVFDSLANLFKQAFERQSPLVCVMATGIVVRTIAPLIRDKFSDPPVVVVDERGRYAISLLSGHIGGANRLTMEVAAAIGAEPVITTATDINGLPAVDLLAADADLLIENREMLARIGMALLKGERLGVVDPFECILPALMQYEKVELFPLAECDLWEGLGVYVGDQLVECDPSRWLLLRPKSLVVGVGCNRGTSAGVILDFLHEVLAEGGLSCNSVAALVTIDAKGEEAGLLEAAERLGVQLELFSRDDLSRVAVPSPSSVVEKHMGTSSVCEAAAILGSRGGQLVLKKRKNRDVTVAVARMRPC